MTELPLINIAALYGHDQAAKAESICSLGDAFQQLGFAVITGHGICAEVIHSLRAAVAKYFHLPLSEKSKHIVSKNNYRGYIPLGFFTPNAARNQADQYQGFKLHTEVNEDDPICADCDLYGPNIWPQQVPELQTTVINYWQECDRVAHAILEALALYLELDGNIFSKAFSKPLTNMTLLHYPPRDPAVSSYGIHPHKDTDVLTLLTPDQAGGLYVRPTKSKRWIEAKPPENALIANVGDMLEIWSGGRFVSTPHKVVNRTDQERISFPYFAVPRFDVEIKPLRKPLSQAFDRRMQAGEISSKIWRSNWPDAAPIEPQYDPYAT